MKVLVVIPCYNEAVNLPRLLDLTLSQLPSLEILVVDDASRDGSPEIIRNHPAFGSRLHLLERPGKLGLGTAYLTGFRWALRHDYEACIQMDGDFSHDPNDIPKLLDELSAGADVAVGTRYLHGVRVINWPILRLCISVLAGYYVRFWLGMPYSDPTSGFKALSRRYLARMDWDWFKAQGYGLQIELLYAAWRANFTVREVPIIFTERIGGQSKMSGHIAFESALRVIELFWEKLRGKPPPLLPGGGP